MTIEQLVAAGRINEALSLLDDRNLQFLLQSRFDENERANRLGTISRDEYLRERNRIVNVILPDPEQERVLMVRGQIRTIGNLPAPNRDELNRMVRLANGIGYNTYKWVYKTDAHLPENVIFAIADDIMNWL